MAIYLIKSGLCLAMVLGTYHLLFEDKKMHQFNRWFLLFGLAFSFLVPLLETSFSIDFSECLNQPDLTTNTSARGEVLSFTSTDASQSVASTPVRYPVLPMLGFLISALMFVRFYYNVTILLRKAITNEQVNYKGAKLVLLKEKTLPHTFGKYIFINELDYRNQKIEEELFTHELTHAKQWHSLDIVLIEALQVLFWINPLLFFYKRAIQLNHEFLADDQVIKSHRRVRDYQELLLDKATSGKVYLASNLNFSITKKRLTMMTKNTSHSKIIFFASVAIPLFVCLLMLFSCSKSNALQAEELSEMEHQELKEDYFRNATIVRNNNDGQKIYKPYADMTAREKGEIPPPPAFSKTLEPLPKGTLVELEADGRILLGNNSDLLAPPPAPPCPPALGTQVYDSLPAITPPKMSELNDVVNYFKDLIGDGTSTFHLESGEEITGEKLLDLIHGKVEKGGFSFTAREGKGGNVEIYLQGLGF